ncbi:ATP-dependent nuclease [Clostridium sp. JS66]|uniref:ATP-dependent nuclease n=1 Tax=Clostridium sp. JS66 TaxID=3064705 RepID=UPI00298D90E4|nr:AAA family ATPase [Clostridium sp. JS66]WPC42388.1 AAA family ATPase [Clostridium sp. JS66]
MYIYKLIIHNFRAIKKLEWKPNSGANILIGGNGSGKSSIAVAIDYLLNPNISWYRNSLSEVDFYNRDTDNSILIEVWFKDVENILEDGLDLLFEHIDKEDKISETGDELVLITKMTCDKSMKVKHSIFSNGKETHFNQAYKQAINFKFITADRDPLKELAFYQNSLLSKTLHSENTAEIIQKIINELDGSARKHLFGDTDFNKSFNELRNTFKDFDLISSDKDSLSLEITDLSERKTLQAFSLVLKNEEVTNPIPLKYQSRGIKNLLLLVALENNIESNGILFLEEIEQNLEPHLQRKIVKSLKKNLKNQVFLTTHSPEIVKLFDFRNIYLMNNGKVNLVPKITDAVDEKFEKLVEKQAKHELISGMFSKGVLLVEGESEKGGLPVFSEVVDYGMEEHGVELIYCNGKSNLINYEKFYKKIGIPAVSILDNDADIKSDLNKLKDSKNPVFLVPEDYEGSLITSKAFKEKYLRIFEALLPFSDYKDRYINPFRVNKTNIKNKLLKEIYSKKAETIENSKSIEPIISILSEEELKEYQKVMLHSNLASIPTSRYIAYYMVEDIENKDDKEIIPCVFRNIFKLTNNYISNKCLCGETNKCIVLSLNKNGKSEICTKCGKLKDSYSNVIEIWGE